MVRIQLSEPVVAEPAGFVVQSPARIALDFPGVTSGLPRNSIELNQGNLRSAHVAQAGDRTRVVLNLNQPTTYRTELQDKAVLITLDPVAAAAVPPQQTRVFAES